MLAVLGPFSRNKSNWYLLACWAMSVAILALPRPYKASAANFIWQILYAPFYQAGESLTAGTFQAARPLPAMHPAISRTRDLPLCLPLEFSIDYPHGRE